MACRAGLRSLRSCNASRISLLCFARSGKEFMLTQPIGLQTVIGVSSKQKFKQELTKFGILYWGIIVHY